MRKSITARLVAIILILMSAGTFVMLAVSAFFSIGNARATASRELQQTAKNAASEFNTWQTSYQTKTSQLASVLSAFTTADRQEASNILRLVLESDPAILGVGAVFEPGAWDGRDRDYINTPGHDNAGRFVSNWNLENGGVKLGSFQDVSALGFYQLTKQTQKPAILTPYQKGGTWITSFTAPILKDGQFIGAVNVNVSLCSQDSRTSQITVLKSGYAMMVSQNGLVLFFPKISAAGTFTLESLGQEKGIDQFAMVASDIAQGKGGSVTAQDPLSGNPAVLFYEPIASSKWGMILVAPAKEMIDEAYQLIMIQIEVGLAGLLLAGILTWISVARIISPLKRITTAANTLADGNLNVTLEFSSQDEIGQLSSAFSKLVTYLQRMGKSAGTIASGDLSHTMIVGSVQDELGLIFSRMQDNLGELIQQVSDEASRLKNAAGEMASAAGQGGEATSQISTTIQEMALGMNQLADNVARTAHSVEQLSHAIDIVALGAQEQAGAATKASEVTSQLAMTIRKVAENAGVVTSESKRASDTAEIGSVRVRETVTEMENIQLTVGVSNEKVKEMGLRSSQIATIVEMIDEIASQTNLLALNAAIEAARAGVHGKGFGVVADEVRKLADRSSNATKEINSLILTIQKTVEEAVSAMDEGASAVEKGVQRAHDAGNSLQEILQAVQMVNQRASGTLGATDRMKALSNDLVSAVDTVTAVIEENEAATKEMKAASNEVSKAIENIASISQQNSAATEEVSASTEELNAQARELNDSAAALQEMAQSMLSSVSQFKLNAGN